MHCIVSLLTWDTNVLTLLKLIEPRGLVPNCLEAYEQSQVPEAEAICRLLPIGMPYQYRMPASIAKYVFFVDLLTRWAANKLCPCAFSPPVVFMVTTDPPVPYTEILSCHKENTHRLRIAATLIVVPMVALFNLTRLHNWATSCWNIVCNNNNSTLN